MARDRAFCFYYEENLLVLREAGFDVVPFAPTCDRQLPAGTDAVYIGGGYPESFAAELEANTSLAAELRDRTAGGMPLYAECGGLMYLGRSLTGFDGVRHEMSGVLPVDVVMDSAHRAIRYVEVRTRAPSALGDVGNDPPRPGVSPVTHRPGRHRAAALRCHHERRQDISRRLRLPERRRQLHPWAFRIEPLSPSQTCSVRR